MNIYLITNLINGKSYIGAEKKYSSEYFGSGRLIIEAIEEFGKENFEKKILVNNIESREELYEIESYFIMGLETLAPGGYNRRIFSWPPSLEASSRGGKIAKELYPELASKAGKMRMKKLKKDQEKFLAHQRKAGRMAGKKLKRWREENPEEYLKAQNKAGEIGGKIIGKIAGKKFKKWMRENPKEFLRYQSRVGKMGAYILFEVDGILQRTTLGALLTRM